MATAGTVSKVRSLYKRILVLHRFLPADLKALGDRYVKDEFRRHKNAAKGEVETFLKEWQGYRDVLQTQVLDSARRQPSSGRFGAALTEDKLLHFQDEQLGQLYQLMLESSRPSGQALVHHPDPL